MRNRLKGYMITPVFNQAVYRAAHPNISNSDYLDAKVLGETQMLKDLRLPVCDIVAQHKGIVINDGSGYGVAGHAYQHSRSMIVEVPDSALSDLRQLKDVRVDRFERTTFSLPKTF